MSADAWESLLSGLRGEFVREAGQRLDATLGLLEALRAQPEDRAALEALMRRFHGFAGSGTTYGFPQVTALGRQAEDECAALLRSATAPGPAELLRWGGTVARLRRELAAVGPAPAAAEDAPPRPALSGRDVLIVDDDAQLVELLSRLLRDEGLSVRGATSRQAAIQAVDERMPEGLIVDIRLPDGSGYDVVKHVRELPHGQTPVVLILSMLTGFLDKVEAIHCGADGYFEKPVDWDALLRRLTHLMGQPQGDAPRVLSVEDDPVHAAFLRRVLESAGYEIRVCQDPRSFESDLIAFRPDLLLMDVVLPGMSGFDLVSFLRQDERYATLPVLFLTTEGQVDDRIRAARVGGDDHLLKPVAPALLLTAVAARIERSRFVKTLLERDGLTGLLTHTALSERAHRLVAQRRRSPERRAAWVMLDVDHFKAVNDRHGHPVGDRVLRSLASLLRRRLRQTDVIGRYGGEEFAVLLEDLDADQALRLVNRLREEFAGSEHAGANGSCFRASFSAGVAMLEGLDQGVAAWRRAADEALYAAKAAGRNQAVLAGRPPGATLLRHPGVSRAEAVS